MSRVALSRQVSDAIAPLIDPTAEALDPKTATTAIFYSINNTLRGLRGVSFGNFLIKQVAIDLQDEFPKLSVFATLSPVPGLRKYVAGMDEGYLRALFAIADKDFLPDGGRTTDALDAALARSAQMSAEEKSRS